MSDYQTVKYREFFKAHPTIASQLPIGFPEQKISWHDMTFGCGTCGRDLPDHYVRGTVTSLIPGVITVEAVACCKHCMHLFHFLHRFRSDGSIEFVRNGEWVKSYGRQDTWWTRLVDRVKQLKPLWENL